jgi:Lon protease-like protein
MGSKTVEDRGSVAVFPLPNTVFFPETVLPLHVFEPRYRKMVRDVSAGNGQIAVTLLKPGWQSDYYGSPPVFTTATLGHIEDLVELQDGRFNLRLVGLHRIRLLAETCSEPYRLMDYAIADEQIDGDAVTLQRAKLELLATQMCVARELSREGAHALVDQSVSLAAAVNGACSSLPLDAELRQKLLEENDLLERRRKVASILDQVLAQLISMRKPGGGGDGGDAVN